MVGAVEVLAVPAGWEDYGRADPAGAHLEGEFGSVLGVARGEAVAVAVAAVADSGGGAGLGAQGGVTGEHTEAL